MNPRWLLALGVMAFVVGVVLGLVRAVTFEPSAAADGLFLVVVLLLGFAAYATGHAIDHWQGDK